MFEEIVGQKKTCDLIEIAILAAKKRNELVDSFLLYGADQYTRHQLASSIVSELGVQFKEVRREQARIKKASEWASDLNSFREGDCFIIEGIDVIATDVLEDVLLPTTEKNCLFITIGKGYSARRMELDLPHICFIIIADKIEEVPNQMVDSITNVIRPDDINERTRTLWFKECLEQKHIQINEVALKEFSQLRLSHMKIAKIVNNFEAYSIVNRMEKVSDEIVFAVLEEIKKQVED